MFKKYRTSPMFKHFKRKNRVCELPILGLHSLMKLKGKVLA